MSTPFDSWDYQPMGHLKFLFQSPDLLNELPQLLDHTSLYKRKLDQEIKQSIADYDTNSNKNCTPEDLQKNIVDIQAGIRNIKMQTASAESQITEISRTIQNLDRTKKNLVLTMTMVKRLQMLIEANDVLSQKLALKNYKQILLYFSVVKELGVFFKPYKSIDEIVALNSIIRRTQNKLVDDIFFDYEEVIAGHQDLDMAPAGEILEIVSQDQREKLTKWFCDKQLKEITTIFRLSDEAGSLENVGRRYIFFKKVLQRIQLDFKKYFPSDWKIDIQITKQFCDFTRKDLENVLGFYFRDRKKSDPDILLSALNATLDFERSLSDLLQTDVFDQAILHLFEPYLLVWISQQELNVNNKFVEYMSGFKMLDELSAPKNASDLLKVLEAGNIPPNIASSCADLFRTFRTILTQTLKLSHGPILIDLAQFFNKYLKKYADQILLPSLPLEDDDNVFQGVESYKYLTMVLNTADYCQNTSDQLESKIKQIIDADLADSISFEDSREYFLELIFRCTSLLLTKLQKDLTLPWRQFQNMNWVEMGQATDVLRYMVDVEMIVNQSIRIVTPLIIRESYAWNFHNKVVESVIYSYMNQWKKIKSGITRENAEQLLLDLKDLRHKFLDLPKTLTDGHTMSKGFNKFVHTRFWKAELLLKLLLLQVKPIDDFVSNYFEYIEDKNVDNFIKILDLKGITDQSAYIDNFKLQLATGGHENLIESNGIIASLKSESEEAADKVRRSIAPKRAPVVVPQIRLPKPQINIANIEKGIKEFAFNGESKVNKMGENFKNFGKFFRKD